MKFLVKTFLKTLCVLFYVPMFICHFLAKIFAFLFVHLISFEKKI